MPNVGIGPAAAADRLVLDGEDNRGNARQGFADEIASLDGDAFVQRMSGILYMSAQADRNPRSDYHWQADACYAEARRRGDEGLYSRALALASSN